MKKFILSLLLVCVACLSAVALGGCNKQIFDFNYSSVWNHHIVFIVWKNK